MAYNELSALMTLQGPMAAMLDASHNGIMVLDREGLIVYYNSAAARIFDEKQSDIVGRHFSAVRPEAWPDLKEVLTAGEPQVGKKLTLPRATIIVNRSAIIHEGEILGSISVFQDISSYEAIISNLQSYQVLHRELEAIFESSEDGLYIADGNAMTIRVNSAYERISGLCREDLVGRNMNDLVREGVFDSSVTQEVLQKRAQATILQSFQGGKQVLVTGTPIFNDVGEIVLVVTNVRDITELNHLRTELEDSRLLSSRYYQTILEHEEMDQMFRDMVVKSKEMVQVVHRAVKAAATDISVLIKGETGTGKGMLARAIHQMSNRKDQPFVKINCGAIPEPLVESELFGYEQGAFTGAAREGKAGLVQAAHEGTLFLDEIGELKPDLQVKLLELIEDKTFTRVGGTKPMSVDVRIIAATHRDLHGMMKDNRFREDLYYRLNVVPITIPPLRERREDVSLLVQRFFEEFRKQHKVDKRLAPDAMRRLQAYPFPGNVRQLLNVLEQMAVMSEHDVIGVGDLPPEFQEPRGLVGRGVLGGLSLKGAVESLERQMISDALRQNSTELAAAKALGVHVTTLWRKATRYGLK